jgi:hypothetical protein
MDPHDNAKVTPRRAPRLATPPDKITQVPYDGDGKHFRRLAKLLRGERADASDLYYFTHDLLYTDEIQDSLLAHVLPFCLEAWREDLHGQSGYGGFVEYFYPLLANRQIFERHLKPAQTAAVSEFMRESIIEEIDQQQGLEYVGMSARPYRWFEAFTTYGVLLTDLDRLWNAWWSLDTVGRAIAVVQYLSWLMYRDDENPVFSPWTPDKGGGPPSLWAFGGFLYTNRWLEPNVQFLKRVLNPSGASEALNRAVERLIHQPGHKVAVEVRNDLPLCADLLAARCAELPRLLETVQEPGKLLEWTK